MWSAIAVTAFYVLLHAFVLPPAGFFSGDQGAKYLQARAFATQGPFTPWITGPERDLDPDRRLVHAALITHNGRVVSVFSWFLPWITAPFLALLGLRGLYVIPALSALIVFEAARRLGRRLGAGDGILTAWAALIATPIVFYGAELWEHSPAAAAVAVAALLLSPDRKPDARGFATAGAVLSIGALFREEVAAAGAALLIARLVTAGFSRHARAISAFVLGFAVIAAAAVPINALVYGSPFSAHTVSELQKGSAYLAIRVQVIHDMLLPAHYPVAFVMLTFAVVAFAVFKVPVRLKVVAAHATVVAFVCMTALVPLWNVHVHGMSLDSALGGTSLPNMWPFVFVLVYYVLLPRLRVREDVGRFLLIASVLFIVVAAATTPSAGGAQWGPRYLLPVAPLLAVLASVVVFPVFDVSKSHATAVRSVACVTLMVSAAVQMEGLRLLRAAKQRNALITTMTEKLTNPGDVIVSDLYWYPQVIETLYGSRRLYFAWSREDLTALINRASRAGLTRINIVVSVPHTGFLPPPEYSTDGPCSKFVRVGRVDIGERMLELDNYVCAGRADP